MARPSKGAVIARRRKNPDRTVYGLRFTAGGVRRFITLDVATREEAEQRLRHVMADVERGVWRPAAPDVIEMPAEEPTFWEFAREWVDARVASGLAPKTEADLDWCLNKHLVWFGNYRLSEITVQLVDAYTTAKARERVEIEQRRAEAEARGEVCRERTLSNGSINHTVGILARILETAVEYELLPSNPAAGRRRRLKAAKPARPWVEPEQLPSLLNGATATGRLLIEVLAGTGLRIGEALALRWQHVDLGTGSLHVVTSKTEKGVREVHLSPALREALTLARADRDPGPAGFVIATSTGSKHNPSNLRRDVLAPAVKAANVKLEEIGIAPIGHLTFHSLRRTYASLRGACGDDVRYTADQLGHEDPRFTLRVYAQATKRRDRLAAPHRKQYDLALEWAQLAPSGTSDALTVPTEAPVLV